MARLREAGVAMIRGNAPHAWLGADGGPGVWQFEVGGAAREELLAHVQAEAPWEDHPPWPVVDPAALPRTRRLLNEVRAAVREGGGLALVRGVPVHEVSVERSRLAAWVMFSMLGRVVDQKFAGTRIYDVKDQGVAEGYGIRRSITNREQPFHTDGGWLRNPPEIIGLFCLETAGEGGLSRVASLATAYGRMADEAPELLARLHRPFCWDRQAEHGPDEPRFSRQPVFERTAAGELRARFYRDYITNGYALAEETIDEEGARALKAVQDFVERDDAFVEFALEPGSFMAVHNRRLVHARSAFRDAGTALSRRHLLRLWCRNEGGRAVEGD